MILKKNIEKKSENNLWQKIHEHSAMSPCHHLCLLLTFNSHLNMLFVGFSVDT